MRARELFEARITVRGRSVLAVVNPPWPRLREMWETATEQRMRGLIIGAQIWWADAFNITHGDLAEAFDPAYPNYDIDNRLMIEDDDGWPVLDYSELAILLHPMLQRYLHAGLLVSIPGMGITTYDYFIERTQEKKQKA